MLSTGNASSSFSFVTPGGYLLDDCGVLVATDGRRRRGEQEGHAIDGNAKRYENYDFSCLRLVDFLAILPVVVVLLILWL